MFYWIYQLQGDSPGALRLFGSPVFRIIAALTTGMVICLFLYPWFIRQLQLRQIGEVIRHDGPESHLAKHGTPTMGGTLLVMSLLLSVLLWCDLSNPFVWMTLAITIGYAVIGFIDDFAKLRGSGGMSERGKIVTQVGLAAAVVMIFMTQIANDPERNFDFALHLPFVKPSIATIDLPGWAWGILATLVIFATSTATNLTDGLDGLAIGPVIVSSATFGLLCYLTGAALFGEPLADYLGLPKVAGVEELAVFCAAMIGAGVGFLWYNTFPALVFMGDVGSLALGGALGGIAVFSKNELLSVIVHGIFVVEFASVIIQRYSFKLTGKRVFAMAPIHHHFEKKGWPESRITVRFWIIAIMLALVALASIKVR